MSLCLRRTMRPRRMDCCDLCRHEYDCAEVARRCVWTRTNGCDGCLACEFFEPKVRSPFRPASSLVDPGSQEVTP